jgi:hypothetical protein
MRFFDGCAGQQGPLRATVEAWEGVYGPVGEDSYLKPQFDRRTGKIDHEVARYMRDHGYGDMDNFYLNLAVFLLEDMMKTKDTSATFEYGRPMKGHGWHPMSNAELIKAMAEQVRKNKP